MYCHDCKSEFHKCEAIPSTAVDRTEYAGAVELTVSTFPTCPDCGSDQLAECEPNHIQRERSALEVMVTTAAFIALAVVTGSMFGLSI